jgi:hypothetical protein
MLDQFEFWTMKEGTDGLTRSASACRVRGGETPGSRRPDEAEGDVMKRWAAEHLERLGFMLLWARA